MIDTLRPLRWWSSTDLRYELAQLNRQPLSETVNAHRAEVVRELRTRQEEGENG